MANKPVLLVIMDGWGIREMEHGNAIVKGKTPNYDFWMKNCERTIVHTSGEHVGLVDNQMGNSEVGHLNLGAGRIVYQDITRIEIAINDGSLAKDPKLLDAINVAKGNGKLHIIGLLSDGGVHSHENHLYALLDVAKENDVNPIVHIITDGRDTPTTNGIDFVKSLEAKINDDGNGQIATVSGRYYAMDRDKRWERTAKAFNAMAKREGDTAKSASDAIAHSYKAEVYDEFIEPTVVEGDNLAIEPGDSIICFNFRADRMRQIVRALSVESFDGADKFDFVDDLHILTYTNYADDLPVEVLFGKDKLKNTLAEVISNAGIKQYHTAETEKYPHVTFFFNGRNEEPFDGEERKIIPSPKVATYDLQPEMSAAELTQTTLDRLDSDDDDFLLVNFANPDMVGHTGSLEAAIKAVETVDTCVKQLVDKVVEKGGVAIVTADHGNCERMVDEITEEPHTYHTVGPVSLFVIGNQYYELFTWGRLCDVAPTVLDLLGVDKPEEMTGMSLVKGVKE